MRKVKNNMKSRDMYKGLHLLFVRCNPLYVSLTKGYAKTKICLLFLFFSVKSVSKSILNTLYLREPASGTGT